jgi:hypothetical protein
MSGQNKAMQFSEKHVLYLAGASLAELAQHAWLVHGGDPNVRPKHGHASFLKNAFSAWQVLRWLRRPVAAHLRLVAPLSTPAQTLWDAPWPTALLPDSAIFWTRSGRCHGMRLGESLSACGSANSQTSSVGGIQSTALLPDIS